MTNGEDNSNGLFIENLTEKFHPNRLTADKQKIHPKKKNSKLNAPLDLLSSIIKIKTETDSRTETKSTSN